MAKKVYEKIICYCLFLIIGLTIFSYQDTYAKTTYNPFKQPMDVLPIFLYEIPKRYNIYGHEYQNDIQYLDLSKTPFEDDLDDILSHFKKLRTVDLRNHHFTNDEIINLRKKYPYIKFYFTIEFNNKIYDSEIEELDLSYIVVDDLEQFKNQLRLFENLKKLDMSESSLSNEELGALREEFPNVQIDWVIHLSKWRFRTDVKSFSVLVYHFDYVKIKSKDLEVFKYCWNMEALDLGHQAITDVSAIAKYLPNLKILILADNKISDISPLAELKQLHYLELFINPIKDISPLAELKQLVDVNLCYDKIKDFTPLFELPMLERIWLVGTRVKSSTIKELKKYHPNAQIVYTGGGSTNSGFRSHERYFEMIKMFKDRYYLSPAFTKYDQGSITSYLNKEVDVIITNPLGSKKDNIIYLTNYGYLKDNKNIKVHVLGEFNTLKDYRGKVIAIIKDGEESILVVSNKKYSADAIRALIEYKENGKYTLIV